VAGRRGGVRQVAARGGERRAVSVSTLIKTLRRPFSRRPPLLLLLPPPRRFLFKLSSSRAGSSPLIGCRHAGRSIVYRPSL